MTGALAPFSYLVHYILSFPLSLYKIQTFDDMNLSRELNHRATRTHYLSISLKKQTFIKFSQAEIEAEIFLISSSIISHFTAVLNLMNVSWVID
jgi:hypothetical protein